MIESNFKHATFWDRLVALSLDILLFLISSSLFRSLLLIFVPDSSLAEGGLMELTIRSMEDFALVFYFVYCTGKWGQTLGKKLMGIRVISLATSTIPTYRQSIMREIVGKALSAVVLGFGYLIMIKDGRKQAWHDKIAGTVVIKINRKPNYG